ncbi:hypothetical protein ABZ807_15205 [Micromonospora sp. NPDC047548]|uniref:hypothetical protein n=1 Tax=Micromonospora sp. NPDC047548 TaxID=3155624 RepID=UPI0033C4072C
MAAAGGAGQVEAYCQRLVPERAPDASPKAKVKVKAAPAEPTPGARPSRKGVVEKA